MTVLTEAQEAALAHFYAAYANRGATGGVFQIGGPAGTGKTELIRALIDRQPDWDIVVCAPTHKACQVLQERLHPHDTRILTCHSFLEGYTRYDRSGQAQWKFKLDTLTLPDLIVLDEVSMVGEDLFGALQQLVQTRGAFVLTTGDSCQLPPVQLESTPFYEQYPLHIRLTHNHRNTQVAYNTCLSQLRHYIEHPAEAPTSATTLCEWLASYMPTYSPQLYSFSLRNVPSSVWKSFLRTTDAVLLAHRTNARQNTVQQLNVHIRRRLFGTHARAYTQGERLIFTDYYRDTDHPDTVCHTNDRATVTLVRDAQTEFYGETYRTWALTLHPQNLVVHVLNAEELDRWQRHDQRVRDDIQLQIDLAPAQQDPLWKTYHEHRKRIQAPVDYAYCLSIHKSQGSSYQAVFVCLSDFIWMLRDPSLRVYAYKLLYVALSRSQTTALVF